MFKNSIFIITTMMLCNTSCAQEEDKRWRVGELMFVNTAALTGAYVLVSMVSTSLYLSEKNKHDMLKTMGYIAAITTTGCVMVEGINGLDHLVNPSNKKNPELKTDIKKSSEQL